MEIALLNIITIVYKSTPFYLAGFLSILSLKIFPNIVLNGIEDLMQVERPCILKP